MTVIKLGPDVEIDIDADVAGHHTEKELLLRILAALKQHEQNQTERDKQMAISQADLATGLTQFQTQIGKVAQEQSDRFDALTKTIADLQAVIAAGGTVSPDVENAFTNVKTALQALDDTIPDAPPPPPARR